MPSNHADITNQERSTESAKSSPPNVLRAFSSTLLNALTPYRYHPLQHVDSIRILNILAGPQDSPIQIQLRHGTLAEMPTTAAVSYEWGSSTNRHEVFCEGHVLMVTSNLYDLLQELRWSGEGGYLWIDAISINQEDLEERAQQVPLMRDIYQNAKIVLIWLGKETNFTQESFEILLVLGRAADAISETNRDFGLVTGSLWLFRDASQTINGEMLLRLPGEPGWDGVMELLSGRSYFTRLWVIQEIILASKATILLKEYRIDLDLFTKGINLVWSCKFLWSVETGDFTVLENAYKIAAERFRISVEGASLSLGTLLHQFASSKATDLRDHIFGLLGLLKSNPGEGDLAVNYTKSPDQVFEAATRHIILHDQDLTIWNYHIPRMETEATNTPSSWVPFYDSGSGNIFMQTITSSYNITEGRNMSIERNILTAYGYIVDRLGTLDEVWRADEINVKSLCRELLTHDPRNEISKVKLRNLGQILVVYNPAFEDWDDFEQQFFSVISRWRLVELGLFPSVIAENLLLKTLVEDSSFLLEKYPEEVESGMRVQDLLKKYGNLQWMDEQANGSERDSKEFENNMNSVLGWPQHGSNGARDLYKTTAGYLGIGPLSSTTAVRVGDCIACIDTAPCPVILRPVDDGMYTLIGNTYIGTLAETPLYRDVNVPRSVPRSVPIRIR